MRRHTLAENIVSALIGIVVGVPLSLYAVNHRTPAATLPPRPEPETYIIAQEDPDPVQSEADPVVLIDYTDPDIPIEVQDSAKKYGKEYNICPELLEAVAYAESRYEPAAKNGSCVGLMQINVPCHMDRMARLKVSKEDLLQIDPNMEVAADYLRELFDQYEDAGEVLMIYNGDSNVVKYRKTGVMSVYASSVLSMSLELEQKHGKGGGPMSAEK